MAEPPRGPNLSRRGLFGLFTKGLKDAQETVREVAQPAAPARMGPRPAFERKLRLDGETIAGTTDAAERVIVDFRSRPLAVGASHRIVVVGMIEPLVLVRVNETHYAACGGSCPLDGSDLLWSGPQDLLWCPSCGSRWRLDGEVARGPARATLRRCHTDVLEDVARISL